jgi:hypothetical protein
MANNRDRDYVEPALQGAYQLGVVGWINGTDKWRKL